MAAGLFVAFSVYHRFVLPTVSDDRRDRSKSYSDTWQEFGRVVVAFFNKKNIGIAEKQFFQVKKNNYFCGNFSRCYL